MCNSTKSFEQSSSHKLQYDFQKSQADQELVNSLSDAFKGPSNSEYDVFNEEQDFVQELLVRRGEETNRVALLQLILNDVER